MTAQAAIATIPRPMAPRQKRAVVAKTRPVKTLPEYLEATEVAALISCCPKDDPRHSLLILVQWRAGLRRAEACALAREDLFLEGETPTLKVRQGKGKKARVVPVHVELRDALAAYVWARGKISSKTLLGVSGSQAWRWVIAARDEAMKRGLIPAGCRIATHTLRHSAARHWLASGVPINVVSRWLGHSTLATTLVYLQILPDPTGYMERVP